MEGLLRLVAAFLRSALALFRSRGRQALIELALRQQLAVYPQTKHTPQGLPRVGGLHHRYAWCEAA